MNKVIRKSLCSFLLLQSVIGGNALLHANDHTDPFSPTIMQLVDGTPYGVNGPMMVILLRVFKKVTSLLQVMVIEPNEVLRACITEQTANNKYSIAGLAALEQSGKLNTNSAAYRALLEAVKQAFTNALQEEASRVQDTKKYMGVMITKFCAHHNLPNSLLDKWSKASSRVSETEMFDTHIPSFEALRAFCADLTFFLKELVQHCPKAKQQYTELLRQQQK